MPQTKRKKKIQRGGGGRGSICVCDARAGGGETGCSRRRLPSTRRATMVRPARMVCGRVAGGRALFPRHLPSAAGDSPRSLRRLRTAVSTSSYNQVSLRQHLLSPRARPSSRSSARPLYPPPPRSRGPPIAAVRPHLIEIIDAPEHAANSPPLSPPSPFLATPRRSRTNSSCPDIATWSPRA